MTMNPYERQSYLDTRVAGVSYDGRQKSIRKACRGDRLKLVRRPENKHDANAVEILTMRHHSLGFIPRHMAREIGDKLKRNTPYSCTVNRQVGGFDPKHDRGLRVDIVFNPPGAAADA